VRRFLMHMGRIEQRNQHVHVQERDHVALRLVPQSIHDLSSDKYRPFSSRQHGYAMSLLDALRGVPLRSEPARRSPAGRRAASSRELFRRLKYIRIDTQSGAHGFINAHQASMSKNGSALKVCTHLSLFCPSSENFLYFASRGSSEEAQTCAKDNQFISSIAATSKRSGLLLARASISAEFEML
jgi:hypothetical protein